jgi:ribulose bisphosphate carboxylase small subunit
MYSIQHRPSLTALWQTHMKDNTERNAIMRAELLKRQFPSHYVRVIDENGALIFQA